MVLVDPVSIQGGFGTSNGASFFYAVAYHGCQNKQNDNPDCFILAQSVCDSFDGNLVSIHDDEENALVLHMLFEAWLKANPNGMIKDYILTWDAEIKYEIGTLIGLNDKELEGTFVWTDGSSFEFSNWVDSEPGDIPEPNNGDLGAESDLPGEDCAFMQAYKITVGDTNRKPGKWSDMQCANSNPGMSLDEASFRSLLPCLA